jgi:membrane protease YdiL (CAAX protease family)
MQTLVIGGPLGEEFGWRGYALPALLDRHGPITSSLILGFIHAFWHLPIWFVIGEGSRDMPFWLFTINVVSQTPIYTWLYLSGKRSVWPVIIFHTTQNIVFFQVFSVPNGMPAFAIFFYIAVLACVLGLVGKTYNKGSSALPRGSIEDAR